LTFISSPFGELIELSRVSKYNFATAESPITIYYYRVKHKTEFFTLSLMLTTVINNVTVRNCE